MICSSEETESIPLENAFMWKLLLSRLKKQNKVQVFVMYKGMHFLLSHNNLLPFVVLY